ncbi:DUF3089 domain-containing protein [Paraliomyxa miuraensis]|uniref:DUF3089 domain-containing protein n=1 Tax=Paraliomyxa miuraensis TaxID=376150 RepID=UPI0022504B89|nr:DUF3089 domain-containing protein [Paraliomyxa miuraensis]MCX4242115.1 DUF3089 domain-containing protein [Paraliomyxa miuraensis]
MLRVLAVLVGVAVVAVVVALATMDRWIMRVLDPGPFDPAATPPAPDYRRPEAWAARPELEDGADVAISELPAGDQRTAPVDVFYLHPTTALGPTWNASVDDPATLEATTRGGTLIQASAFNACCAVYAPRYRQANGRAFVHPDAESERAIEVALSDVSAAFDEFLAHTGDRPFILAGHSQGAVIGARLLRERIAGQPVQARMVAAYLIGAPLRPDQRSPLVPPCERPDQTGCVVGWNARGPEYRPNGLEFDADDPDPMRDRLCVNPITWTTDGTHAPASANAGALFLDTDAPAIKPAFADAQCVDGALVVTTMGDPERDFMSRLLLWTMGPDNYHPIEYQMFYLGLRRNAAQRVEAFGR